MKGLDENSPVWQIDQELKAIELAELYCQTREAQLKAWARSFVNVLRIVTELENELKGGEGS